jgi:DNA repair exonuclease SbcCD nuclease subunit
MDPTAPNFVTKVIGDSKSNYNSTTNQIEKSDIIFGHFEIETFKMNSFKDCEEGLSIKELLIKSSLIISGHFHFRHEKRYGAGTILYVGNPFQMDFGDCDNIKGYHILDIDTLEYEFFENTISPHYKKISLSDLVEATTLTYEIKSLFNNNIIKFKIDKNISQEDLSILTSKLNLLRPESLQIEYDISSNKINNGSSDKDLSGIDITCAIEEFVNLLDIEDKTDILNYTLELYKKCIV